MTEVSSFQRAASSFAHDLDALREMLDPVMAIALHVSRGAAKKHLEELEKLGTLQSEEGTTRIYEVPVEHMRQVDKIYRKNSRAATATKLLPRTFLVSFVSVYDAYLGRLIKVLLETTPEILDSSERQLAYKQLSAYASIEDARAGLIEAEVESVLRQSHCEQFKWLEGKFKLKLREGLASWPSFIELTERRNLFVHTHGVVSSQYISVCRTHGCAVESVTLGSTLEADKDYLIESYKCLYEIGIKLSQVLWRKLKSGEMQQADAALNRFAYDLLVDEKYDIATRLLEFAVKVLKRYSSDSYRRMFIVNLAQAYKFSGKEGLCKELVSKEDWSACSDDYSVCISVLKDEFGEAAKVMERIGISGPLRERDYIDWPIFRKFRESSEFRSAFKKIFGRDPMGTQKHDTHMDQVLEQSSSE